MYCNPPRPLFSSFMNKCQEKLFKFCDTTNTTMKKSRRKSQAKFHSSYMISRRAIAICHWRRDDFKFIHKRDHNLSNTSTLSFFIFMAFTCKNLSYNTAWVSLMKLLSILLNMDLYMYYCKLYYLSSLRATHFYRGWSGPCSFFALEFSVRSCGNEIWQVKFEY